MKLFKKLFCKLGWHSYFVGYELVEKSTKDIMHTGYLDKHKCKWCDFVGRVDSQGNLYDPDGWKNFLPKKERKKLGSDK